MVCALSSVIFMRAQLTCCSLCCDALCCAVLCPAAACDGSHNPPDAGCHASAACWPGPIRLGSSHRAATTQDSSGMGLGAGLCSRRWSCFSGGLVRNSMLLQPVLCAAAEVPLGTVRVCILHLRAPAAAGQHLTRARVKRQHQAASKRPYADYAALQAGGCRHRADVVHQHSCSLGVAAFCLL
jgi:hypothetical protein